MLTRNRGCQTCRRIFCKGDFIKHRNGYCGRLEQPTPKQPTAMVVPACTVNLVMLGEGSVGKTSLLRRYTEDQFTNELPFTMGVDFKQTRLILRGVSVIQSIWDTAARKMSAGRKCEWWLLIIGSNMKQTYFRVCVPQAYRDRTAWVRASERASEKRKTDTHVCVSSRCSNLFQISK